MAFKTRYAPRQPSKRKVAADLSFLSLGTDNPEPMPEQRLTTQRKTPRKQAESAVNDAVIKLWRLVRGVLYRNRRGFVRLPGGGGFPYGFGPNGSGDVAGWTRVRITAAMVGKVLPIYTEFESKTEVGRLEEHQVQRIEELHGENAIAGCVRCDEDAETNYQQWLAKVTS